MIESAARVSVTPRRSSPPSRVAASRLPGPCSAAPGGHAPGVRRREPAPPPATGTRPGPRARRPSRHRAGPSEGRISHAVGAPRAAVVRSQVALAIAAARPNGWAVSRRSCAAMPSPAARAAKDARGTGPAAVPIGRVRSCGPTAAHAAPRSVRDGRRARLSGRRPARLGRHALRGRDPASSRHGSRDRRSSRSGSRRQPAAALRTAGDGRSPPPPDRGGGWAAVRAIPGRRDPRRGSKGSGAALTGVPAAAIRTRGRGPGTGGRAGSWRAGARASARPRIVRACVGMTADPLSRERRLPAGGVGGRLGG